MNEIRWWIDASFAVHTNFRSHTGATITLGKGSGISSSAKQKINTRSSTEAEFVGVDDVISMVLWVRLFLEAQGYAVTDNIVYQDNKSAMLLENNGRQSSGKRTRHINIRYYFVTDNIKQDRLRVEHCPTDSMLADFFTKPLQGAKFRTFRDQILNVQTSVGQECVETSGIDRQTDVNSRGAQSGSGHRSDSGHRSYADVAAGRKE